MAINIVETKAAANMRLLVDSETAVNVAIPGIVADPDKEKLWAVAKAINQCQEHAMTRLLLSRTVEIDEN